LAHVEANVGYDRVDVVDAVDGAKVPRELIDDLRKLVKISDGAVIF
jgi:hypothetical protein